MVPPKVRVSTSETKNPHTKKEATPVQEETPKTFDPVNFPKAYVPPKSVAKQVIIQKEVNYDMVTPMIPLRVTFEGDMLGLIGNLRYLDHDLEDLNKFP
jgi:hypothetical protein